MTRISFLGPHGTFAEEAVLTQPDLAALELVPLRSVPEVISAVEPGDADVGLVPIENSIEGSVSVTLDTLAFDTDLLIQREIDLPVSLNLCAPRARSSTTSAPSSRTRTRSAQTPRVAEQEAAAAPTRSSTNSTAEAAEQVAQAQDPTRAAIGTAYGAPTARSRAARHRHRGPSREPDPVRARRPRHPRADRSRQDERSSASSARTGPGSLLAILQEFAARAINLTKLESRPTKRSLGDYCFFIDFDGHVADELVADCLRNLVAKQAEVKFLGSYPVGGRGGGRGARGRGRKAWQDATRWVDELRAQIAPDAGAT